MQNFILNLDILVDYYELNKIAHSETTQVVEYLKNKPNVYVLPCALKNFASQRKIIEEILSCFKIAKVPSYAKINPQDIEASLLLASAKAMDAVIITRDKNLLENFSQFTILPEFFLQNIKQNNFHIDFANLKKQHFLYLSEIEEKIDKILTSAKFIMGDEVALLEKNLAQFTEAKYAISCSSGTDALLLALMAIDIKPGDEVITSVFTFIATAEAIALLGAKPVFVDIDEQTYNLNVQKIEQKITPKTKAIIPVSLYGQPADMDEINTLAQKYNLCVIEDAAQSFGAVYKGKKSCNLSKIGCTSFFPAKPLGCYGDGGAIFTNDPDLAEKIVSLRTHGQTKRYVHQYIGLNGRLDAIQAAVLNVKLKHYPHDLALRNKVAHTYTQKIKNMLPDKVILPVVKEDRTSAWAQYSIRLPQEQHLNRENIITRLKNKNIPTAVHYPQPLHKQACFEYLQNPKEQFPIAEKISKEILSLPMNPYLTDEELDFIVTALKESIA
ncbi:MAG: DegT/DnrJ/EryC1/StrS family aminotransferase [Desulfonauticus sp.]|nr:DegT/DnrJ/EryC1/StrS family aminotransferase [Desulfonauticus sp.]